MITVEETEAGISAGPGMCCFLTCTAIIYSPVQQNSVLWSGGQKAQFLPLPIRQHGQAHMPSFTRLYNISDDVVQRMMEFQNWSSRSVGTVRSDGHSMRNHVQHNQLSLDAFACIH